MKHVSFQSLARIHWTAALKRNRYTFVSLLLGGIYIIATVSAISFIVSHIRYAFSIDEEAVQSQIVTFDIAGYEKTAKRFNLERKE